jgi:hypothetical protein
MNEYDLLMMMMFGILIGFASACFIIFYGEK